jgi:C_GCAxxG_C_C family probable redox protein
MAMAGAAAVGVPLCGSPPEGGKCSTPQEVLKRGDKIHLEGKAEEIIQRAYELGQDYERRYGGCAQCAVAALQDAVPFVPRSQAVFRAGSCLDGGATPTGLQNCGAFTGCGMVIGHLCGRTRANQFQGSSAFSHDLIRRLYQRFKEQYGSVLCQDVKKGAEGDCPKVVARAARWAAEVLLSELTDSGSRQEAGP